MHDLTTTARAMVTGCKGILAADESNATITKRFDRLGIESTAETRRAYRQMLFTRAGYGCEGSSIPLLCARVARRSSSSSRAACRWAATIPPQPGPPQIPT